MKRLIWNKKILAVAIAALAYVGYLSYGIFGSYSTASRNTRTVQQIVSSEELILALTPSLQNLNHGMLNLQMPDYQSDGIFADEVSFWDLVPNDSCTERTGSSHGIRVQIEHWSVDKTSQTVASSQLQMWEPLFDEVDYFDHAKFYIIRGKVDLDDPHLFDADVGFSGVAFLKDGRWRGIRAKQHVRWRFVGDETTGHWFIDTWELKSLTTSDSEDLLFKEVAQQVLARPTDRYEARVSAHDEQLIRHVNQGRVELPSPEHAKYFVITAQMQHPALSVVDLDRDGWDDLYVMTRWQKNQLLHNRGDGTFVNVAEKLGLDVWGASAAAVFADFDNDGDSDLLLGRTLERSQYYMNEDGQFVDCSESHLADPLPYLVTSASAADYNGDGLLDVYLCTYGFPAYGAATVDDWASEMLPADQARYLTNLYGNSTHGYHRFVNSIGPPNVLLVNRGGGRFEIAAESKQLALWTNCFQATWSDFDDDGDPDLYVSNDFAPDFLFRNDGSAGFKDITVAAGGEAMAGFGMGASWGDYDNDGRQDLYISNMYSKAGLRITAQIDGMDPRFRRSADGNRLFRNLGNGKFNLRSGEKPSDLHVVKAGWSWGGQFMDVDNDGYLDLYVTNGFRTTPEAISTPVDT